MSAGVAAAGIRSLLDKPLHQLTEDDLSQLTREDCRRYLKDKGMRRPSWNKSQAIQQVISLKSLLEQPPPTLPTPTPANPPLLASVTPLHPPPKAAVISPPNIPTPHVTLNSSSSVKELSPVDMEGGASFSADGAPEPPVGLLDLDPPPEVDSAQAAIDHRADALRCRATDVSNFEAGQMTIFYCGKVNVYDGVSAEKAHDITQLAASPFQFLQAEINDGDSTQWDAFGHLTGSCVKLNVTLADATFTHPVQTGVDGRTKRQVSLQRYLEKKKDRGKFKYGRKIGSSSSGLEMYLNQQMRIQVVNGQSSPSDVSTPTQPGRSLMQCCSVENQSNNAVYVADLNERV